MNREGIDIRNANATIIREAEDSKMSKMHKKSKPDKD